MKIKDSHQEDFKKVLDEIISIPLEVFTIHLWDKLFEKFSDFTDELKLFLFYQEKNCPYYALEDALKWFKDNIPPRSNLKGGVFKEKQIEGKPIRLHLFFINDKKALIDGNHAHLFVNTLELEKDFLILFQDKQLLIIE